MNNVIAFWEDRYRANRMPWDLGGIPSAMEEFLARQPKGGRALVPGCGRGWEICAFEKHGWEVTAIDLAPTAVERARAISQDPSTRILLGDFFLHDLENKAFSLIYERAFLCALPPELRSDYQSRMSQLIAEGGILMGYFFYGHEAEPPPFPISEPAGSCFLNECFHLVEDRSSPDALPLFVSGERWQIWKLRPGTRRATSASPRPSTLSP